VGQIIIGAGMAGLLAARMLSALKPVVFERQGSLPHNHSAVLRFSSSVVGDVLGIPFKRVRMTKTVLPWRNPVADALAYSRKVIGEYRTDRSVLLPERWQSAERFIAPENLIEQMAQGVDIKYDTPYDFPVGREKVISTVPMPILARAMNYHIPIDFSWVRGVTVLARVEECDAYASVLIPDPAVPFYRVSVTGDRLIVEMTDKYIDGINPGEIAYLAARFLGMERERISQTTCRETDYAKIAPIDDGKRKNFIYWASTIKGRAYQLGRFATWRPSLQMDDLVKDVRVIESWINSSSSEYDMEQHERRKAYAIPPAGQ
jgi:hypothetical protein